MSDTGPRVYCSGPLFSPEERAAMGRIAGWLEAGGYATFLPQRDGLELFAIPAAQRLGPLAGALPASGFLQRAIFDLDVFQLVERCPALVVNLNGRVPDEGAVAEAAIAFAVGRPVLAYKDDPRSAIAGLDNSMVTGLYGHGSPARDAGQLLARLGKALSVAARDRTPDLPPALAAAVARGRRIWQLLGLLPRPRDATRDMEALMRELGEAP